MKETQITILKKILKEVKEINKKLDIPVVKSDDGYITFPEKTAKEIVDECNNTIDGHNFLYDTDWYKDADFFTKEKCRPRTVKIPTEISCVGKSWNECKGDMPNFAEVIYMMRESKEYRELFRYGNKSGAWYTWTSSVDPSGKRFVDAGGFDDAGVSVDGHYPDSTWYEQGCSFLCS